jgi:hypothetical protein
VPLSHLQCFSDTYSADHTLTVLIIHLQCCSDTNRHHITTKILSIINWFYWTTRLVPPQIYCSFICWTYLNVEKRPICSFSLRKKSKSNPCAGLKRAWGLHEVEATTFQDNRHLKVLRLSALRTGHLYPQGIFLIVISVRDSVDPKAIVRPEGLCQWKIAIEPATQRIVDKCQNQLRPRMPPVINVVLLTPPLNFLLFFSL